MRLSNTIAALLLLSTGFAYTGFAQPGSVDMKNVNMDEFVNNPCPQDLAITNLDYASSQSRLLAHIQGVKKLHLSSSKPTRLAEEFATVLRGAESLYIDNALLSENLIKSCLEGETLDLTLARVSISENVHNLRTNRILNLSMIEVSCSSKLKVVYSETMKHLTLTFPGLSCLYPAKESLVLESLTLLAGKNRDIGANTRWPDHRCRILRLDGFIIKHIDARRMQAERLLITSSVLKSHVQFSHFDEMKISELVLEKCVVN
ncbi:hypothetical protein [Aureliella helgolandensis]|uniref:Receptor L-domain domain-containing protein n=1 Tax=Aureliella helgolandensis TaxID=2527968 RepID=A0A518G3F4_9BACT|nr:hypothetical protein [Aureliella helgolandensis]QDV23090.1 hypothetical protein Q31a_13850 [Aureliella helgolandensis]